MSISFLASLAPVLACLAAQDVAVKDDGDAKILAAFQATWQAAAAKAAPATVSLRVERDPSGDRPHRPFGNPMATGGVFAARPERIEYNCPRCRAHSDSPGDCGKCDEPMRRVAVAYCSGTVVDADGFLVTSLFNVDDGPGRITATIEGQGDFECKKLGHSKSADIALLKIDTKKLTALGRVNLAQVRVGRPVVALGRGPDGRGLTLNPGIISAPGRLSGKGIQTDARLNYGSVGGPLVDIEGNLVGITCKVDVKNAATFGQNSGVSFAVTWDHLNQLLPELKAGKAVNDPAKPFLGVAFSHQDEETAGVRITDIIKGGAAEKAGLRKDDIILEFDGAALKAASDLIDAIQRKAINDPFTLKVLRDGQEKIFTGTLGERTLDD